MTVVRDSRPLRTGATSATVLVAASCRKISIHSKSPSCSLFRWRHPSPRQHAFNRDAILEAFVSHRCSSPNLADACEKGGAALQAASMFSRFAGSAAGNLHSEKPRSDFLCVDCWVKGLTKPPATPAFPATATPKPVPSGRSETISARRCCTENSPARAGSFTGGAPSTAAPTPTAVVPASCAIPYNPPPRRIRNDRTIPATPSG